MDEATLLIPIITPGFFRSPACRDELTRFLTRERTLGREDLILPIYYVSAPELDDQQRREADELARVLAARQFADWRELRFEPLTSPVVGKALAQLASRMRDTFWHPPPTQPSSPGGSRAAATRPAEVEATSTQLAVTANPATKSEPPTHVVDAYQRGDFTTISAAIATARPGDRILVRPGLYQEGLVVDKPLEILGDGPAEDIEVQARNVDALVFRASIGRVTNLTLRQTGGEGKFFAVDISQGRLELEGCEISSQSLACVVIRDGADPRLRRNRIHASKNDGGVFVYNSGLGMLEDNDITNNGKAGVEIKVGGNPTLRNNRINHNNYEAVWVHEGGGGVIEDNDLTGNTRGPWGITKDSQPKVIRKGNRE